MELLEYFYLSQSNLIKPFQKQISSISNCYPQISVKIVNKNIEILCVLDTIGKIDIICEIKVNNEDRTIELVVMLSQKYIYQAKNLDQKYLIQNIFLEMNRKTSSGLLFKIMPFNSNIYLGYILNFSNINKINFSIIQFIIDTLIAISLYIKNDIHKIISLLKNTKTYVPQLTNFKAYQKNVTKQFKTFLKSSSFYAWRTYQNQTSKNNLKKSDFYTQTKSKFRTIKKSLPTNKYFNKINKVILPEVDDKYVFFGLTHSQDNELKENYLNKSKNIVKDSRQMEQITSQNIQNLKEIKQKKTIILKTQKKNIKIMVQKFKDQQVVDLEYEKKIIKSLQKQELIGIPKYYIIKNKIEQTKNLLLTNLINFISYQKYLQNNKQTVSFKTKLSLLTQIAKIIKYLRDQQIIFNNLTPQNIKIKKGIINITNFTNCHHPVLTAEKSTNYKNNYPYVNLNHQMAYRNYNSQKSDVFSLGAIIHFTLFRKNQSIVKSSHLLFNSFENIKNIHQCQKIICPQKYESYGGHYAQLFGMLSLVAIKNKKRQQQYNLENGQQFQNIRKGSQLEQPYLDWMLIMMQYAQQNFIFKF